MTRDLKREPMLDMYIFEAVQLLEKLEEIILKIEKAESFDMDAINEIFRIMHTIKGSSAMMMFNNISLIAHNVEDLFYFLREEKPEKVDHAAIIDIVLCSLDFIKVEIAKVEEGIIPDGDPSNLNDCIKNMLKGFKSINTKNDKNEKSESCKASNSEDSKFYIGSLNEDQKNANRCYEAVVFFEVGCEMENIRAYSLLNNLKDKVEIFDLYPQDILENEESKEVIKAVGFRFVFWTDLVEEDAKDLFSTIPFIQSLQLKQLENELLEQKKETKSKAKEIHLEEQKEKKEYEPASKIENVSEQKSIKQSFISVNISKLDILMDLVGELVISESMVTNHPEVLDLELDSFTKASRHLNKLTSELQNIVMSIRMVPLTATFQKMNRIVRDMSKKLNKEIILEVIGEETEVDKNIIENISDPIMHLIRNSLDHGVESAEERICNGKSSVGKVTLEAKSAGGEVWISIKDDGRGLDKDKILAKAIKNGLVKKPQSEITDREIYSYILLPGFSTKDAVTEFSGRGVGMDVVAKNIEKLGGSVYIESETGVGSIFTIKIPLTLAIVNGMSITIGDSNFIVPTTSIKKCFKLSEGGIINDPDGNEMIMIRGECFSVLRLYNFFKLNTDITQLQNGIFIMIENDYGGLCLFADALIGEQQVVVKALPNYIKKVKGIAGCTLLGDGSVSLILDSEGLINFTRQDK